MTTIQKSFFVTRVRRGGTSEPEIMAQSPSQASQQVGFMAQQMRLRYGVRHSKTSRGFWGGTTAGGTYIHEFSQACRAQGDIARRILE